nr:MAG TPA: hypothetical protein [Caudoviricetes sp.]
MKIDYKNLDEVVRVLNRLPDRDEHPHMYDGEYIFLSYQELERLTALNLI